MCVHRSRLGTDGVVDLGTDILEGWPLRQVLIWTWPGISERLADPTGRGLRLRQNHASIYLFSGPFWTVPSFPGRVSQYRNSTWRIPPPDPANAPPGFDLELARRCIALGRGRVLDPHAGTGTTALAALEVGRIWTLFDETDAYRKDFHRRMDVGGEADCAG